MNEKLLEDILMQLKKQTELLEKQEQRALKVEQTQSNIFGFMKQANPELAKKMDDIIGGK